MKGTSVSIRRIEADCFEVGSYSIDFFGAKGAKRDGRWWTNRANHEVLAAIEPISVLQVIVEQCIAGDVAKGVDDQIAQIHLGAHEAVLFYLGGGITLRDFAKAEEHVGYIDFPDMEIGGRIVTLRILQSYDFIIVTCDKDGNEL